jgi:hypothetical protein
MVSSRWQLNGHMPWSSIGNWKQPKRQNMQKSKLFKGKSKSDASETTHLQFDGIYIDPKRKEEQM